MKPKTKDQGICSPNKSHSFRLDNLAMGSKEVKMDLGPLDDGDQFEEFLEDAGEAGEAPSSSSTILAPPQPLRGLQMEGEVLPASGRTSGRISGRRVTSPSS